MNLPSRGGGGRIEKLSLDFRLAGPTPLKTGAGPAQYKVKMPREALSCCSVDTPKMQHVDKSRRPVCTMRPFRSHREKMHIHSYCCTLERIAGESKDSTSRGDAVVTGGRAKGHCRRGGPCSYWPREGITLSEPTDPMRLLRLAGWGRRAGPRSGRGAETAVSSQAAGKCRSPSAGPAGGPLGPPGQHRPVEASYSRSVGAVFNVQ